MASKNHNVVDPDPYLLADLCMNGAGVILQFVAIYLSLPDRAESDLTKVGRRDRLQHLERALAAYETSIFEAERTIKRGSKDPDAEFYQARFRISEGTINLSKGDADNYFGRLCDVLTNLAQMTRWIGSIIASDAEFGSSLGKEVHEMTKDASNRLNNLIESGGPIEAIMIEARFIRDALRRAIERRLDGGNQ